MNTVIGRWPPDQINRADRRKSDRSDFERFSTGCHTRQQLATYKTTSVVSSLLCLLVRSVLFPTVESCMPNHCHPKAVCRIYGCVRGCHFLSVSTQQTLTPAIRFLCLVNVLRIPNIEDFILLFVVSLLTHTRALT